MDAGEEWKRVCKQMLAASAKRFREKHGKVFKYYHCINVMGFSPKTNFIWSAMRSRETQRVNNVILLVLIPSLGKLMKAAFLLKLTPSFSSDVKICLRYYIVFCL